MELRYGLFLTLTDIDGKTKHMVNIVATCRFSQPAGLHYTQIFLQDSHQIKVLETIEEIEHKFRDEYTGIGQLRAIDQDQPVTLSRKGNGHKPKSDVSVRWPTAKPAK